MATAIQATGQIEGVAKARYIRVSPQKARLVIDLIRGQRAEDALQTLRFTKKRVAKEVEKTLRSAIANAERKAEDSGESLDVDALFVTRCYVNEGPRWKRLRPAPMGRGVPLPEADRSHHCGSGGASPRSSGSRCGSGRRRASIERREGRRAESPQSA